MTAERFDEEAVERLTRVGIERDAVGFEEPPPDLDELDREQLAAIDAGHAKNGTPNGAPKKKKPRWSASHVIARYLAAATSPPRLALAGMTNLEAATRGGLPVGAQVTMTGAPGASKTALSIQWAHEWAVAGARVVYLCADQPPEKAIARLGERMGVERDHLEGLSGPDERRRAWAGLARELEVLPNLVFVDGGEDGLTIETASEVLDHLPGDGPRVLVVDSIQEAMCNIVASAAVTGMISRIPRREQIDASGRACRRIARRGILVIVVSEMSRGAYGGGDPKRRTSALASSKESGSIEYRADLLMVLQRQKSDPDLVDVSVPKSRLGSELDLRLKINRRHASLVEVPREDRQRSGEAPQATVRAEVLRDAAELAKVLAAHPAGLGSRDLRAKVRASGLGWGSPRIDAALAALADGGVVGIRAVDRTPNTRGRTWALEHIQEGRSDDGA